MLTAPALHLLSGRTSLARHVTHLLNSRYRWKAEYGLTLLVNKWPRSRTFSKHVSHSANKKKMNLGDEILNKALIGSVRVGSSYEKLPLTFAQTELIDL